MGTLKQIASLIRSGYSVDDALDKFDGFSVDNAFETDISTTSGDTRFLVYDVDNGKIEKVTVGAADSGGVGYKVLRIPN